MKPFARLSLFAIPMLLTGCYAANQLDMDGLKPADITIPGSVKSLSVVSRCDLDSAYKLSLESLGRVKDFHRDSIMAKQVVLGCSDALLKSPRFDLFNPVVSRSLIEVDANPSGTIPWDKVRIVAGDPPHDAVLSLEIAKINDTIKYSVLNGWLSTYQYFVIVKTTWRLYRLADFQSKEFNFTDTTAFDIDSPSDFSSSPDRGIECISQAMYESGVKTARRLAPWWTDLQRFFFTMMTQNSMNGTTFLKEGNWREAAEIWRPYTGSKNKMMAAKACFNMALTCEMANNIPAALDWLKKSESHGMLDYFIKSYRSILTKRKSETEKLDEQMK